MVDWPDDEERFEVVYEVYSIRKRHRIRIKTRVPEHDCLVDSMTDLWMGADFMEREVFDMMGIRFNHHPDLRRILMPDDYTEGYPLRKDFPVQGKGWRDTFDFLKDKQNAFDVIVLDPPAFAKSRDSKHQAVLGYKRLNALALKLIKPNGIIFTFSCSGVIDKMLFYN